LEGIYDLSEGALDSQEGKLKRPSGLDVTMLDLMLAEFEFRNRNDPFFGARCLKAQILKERPLGPNCVGSDSCPYVADGIRTVEEACVLLWLGKPLKIIYMTGGTERESDRNLADIFDKLKNSMLCSSVEFLSKD
jgi:hypothetical protein